MDNPTPKNNNVEEEIEMLEGELHAATNAIAIALHMLGGIGNTGDNRTHNAIIRSVDKLKSDGGLIHNEGIDRFKKRLIKTLKRNISS